MRTKWLALVAALTLGLLVGGAALAYAMSEIAKPDSAAAVHEPGCPIGCCPGPCCGDASLCPFGCCPCDACSTESQSSVKSAAGTQDCPPCPFCP